MKQGILKGEKSMKKLRIVTLCLMLFTVFMVIPATGFADKDIVVGGKNYTEQYILPQMAAILLEQNGFNVAVKTGVASTLLRKALENAQVDLYFEYTGTAYMVYYKGKDRAIFTDSEKIFNFLKSADTEKNLVWLDRFNFNNTYTLMLRKQDTQQFNIQSISDLAKFVKENPHKLTFAMSAEDWERPDAFRGVMKTYGFRVPANKVKKMGSGLVYKAMKDKQVDCSIGFSTDGRIAAFNFVNLDDDKHFFPVYNPAPVVRKEVLDTYPEIADILKPLTEAVSTREMQTLNAEVAIEHKTDRDVAMEYLKKKGLLK